MRAKSCFWMVCCIMGVISLTGCLEDLENPFSSDDPEDELVGTWALIDRQPGDPEVMEMELEKGGQLTFFGSSLYRVGKP